MGAELVEVIQGGLAQEQQNTQADIIQGFINYLDRSPATSRAYTINLRQYMAYLLFTKTEQPTRATIIDFKEWLSSEHPAIILDGNEPEGYRPRLDGAGRPIMISCKPNTISQYLRSVCLLYRYAASVGLYPNIADNIHSPKLNRSEHKKEALQPAEALAIETMLKVNATNEQGKRLLAMYMLCVNLGLRTIELNRASVKDIELKGGRAYMYVWGKGHTEPDTKKPIAEEVYRVLMDYLDSRADGSPKDSPLFVATGNRSGGRRIATTTISTMLKGAMKAAGYDSDRLSPHSLRHTAGTGVMKVTGNNIYLAQQYLRHASPATTEIYLHTDTMTEQATTAEALYNYYHNKADGRQIERNKLNALLDTMSLEQLKQMEYLAATITA